MITRAMDAVSVPFAGLQRARQLAWITLIEIGLAEAGGIVLLVRFNGRLNTVSEIAIGFLILVLPVLGSAFYRKLKNVISLYRMLADSGDREEIALEALAGACHAVALGLAALAFLMTVLIIAVSWSAK